MIAWRIQARGACLLAAVGLVLTACSGFGEGEAVQVSSVAGGDDFKGRLAQGSGSIFGEGGIRIGGPREERPEDESGLGVNSYLWRATLDTLSFMPIASADPFGGTVLTDWYVLPSTPDERFKANAYILDRQLRATGLRVSVFRQVRDPITAAWTDAPVEQKTASELENTILSRARELRVASIAEAQ